VYSSRSSPCFGEMYCLQLQVRRLSQESNQQEITETRARSKRYERPPDYTVSYTVFHSQRRENIKYKCILYFFNTGHYD
jgi:hypothetical protein